MKRAGFVGGPIQREDVAHGTTIEVLPELRERAVRLVHEHTAERGSQWGAIRSVGEKLGCSVEAVRRWVRQAERDAAGHVSTLDVLSRDPQPIAGG